MQTISEQVHALLAERFPEQPIHIVAPTSGGASHLSLHARIGQQACVIKMADRPQKRADIRHEAQLLWLLAKHQVPAAELLALIEQEPWTLAVTRRLPGTPGLELLQTPEVLPEVFARFGQTLARVHQTPLPEQQTQLRLSERITQYQQQLANLPLETTLFEQLAASLQHAFWDAEDRCLVHGDSGLHNIMWHEGQIALLDWEWASIGQPLLDLAWLRWTIAWRNLPLELWQAALKTYRAERPLPNFTNSDLHSLMLGQIASILLRVQAEPAAYAEWIRRAEWTCKLAFEI